LVDLGAGNDTFTGGNDQHGDKVRDHDGADSYSLNGGNDTYFATGNTGTDGVDTVNGGAGRDVYDASGATNAVFTNTMIYSSTFSNMVVTANYAGYEAFLATATGGGTLSSNSPGRIEIEANNLDLTQTRIRGESIVSIRTPHLVGSSGLIVDAPNINYNIGSTNGLLSVSGDDLALAQVQRFGGFINAWSGFWTNFASQVVTNIVSNALDATDEGNRIYIATSVRDSKYGSAAFHFQLMQRLELVMLPSSSANDVTGIGTLPAAHLQEVAPAGAASPFAGT